MRDQSSEPADAVTTEQDRVTPGGYAGVSTGERCANCQATLASDQRYCVNCGERRGKSRFSADSFNAAPAPAPPRPAPPRRPRASSGATLIAGVATLLIALGVGVLIGHNSGSSTPKTVASSAPQIITVGGGGGGSSAGSSSTSKGKKSKSKRTKVVHVTKKVAAKATAAASKALGGSKALAPATVQPGGACTNGQAGCQNGKFTGNFFGGG